MEDTELRSSRRLITPEVASEILSRNNANRTINKGNVKYIVNEIKEGKFVFNAQPIIISDNGDLVDGQHRLLACVEAGIPIDCFVVENIPKSAAITMDTGVRRGLKDMLHMEGVKNSTIASSITKLIHYKKVKANLLNPANMMISPSAGRDTYLENKERISSVVKRLSAGDSRFMRVQKSLLGYCFFLFLELDVEAGQVFIDGFLTGLNISPESPESRLRMALNDIYFHHQGRKKNGEFKNRVIDLIIRGWNIKRRNEKRLKCNLERDVHNFSDITEAV